MLKKLQSYKVIGILLSFISVSWLVLAYFFFEQYMEAIYFVSLDAGIIETNVFVLTYYIKELLPYFILLFILLNITLLMGIIFILIEKNYGWISEKIRLVPFFIFGIAVFFCMTLKIWPILLPLVIITLLIGFIIYTVYKIKTDEITDDFEEYEVIKKEGPFDTQEEAENFYNKFCQYWRLKFSNKGLELNSRIFMGETKHYYLEIYVTENLKELEI